MCPVRIELKLQTEFLLADIVKHYITKMNVYFA